MKKKQVEKEKSRCLNKLKKAKGMSEALLWQNVYFWWLRNEDRILSLIKQK